MGTTTNEVVYGNTIAVSINHLISSYSYWWFMGSIKST